MCGLPAEQISASELAVIELSRAVDHVVSLAPRLKAEDLAFIRKEHRRLLDLLLDAADGRRAA